MSIRDCKTLLRISIPEGLKRHNTQRNRYAINYELLSVMRNKALCWIENAGGALLVWCNAGVLSPALGMTGHENLIVYRSCPVLVKRMERNEVNVRTQLSRMINRMYNMFLRPVLCCRRARDELAQLSSRNVIQTSKILINLECEFTYNLNQ